MIKKILSTLLLIGIFTFAIGTVNVSAALITGRCGENLTYVLDEDCTLTISGTGDMYDYAYKYTGDKTSTAPWFSNADIIRKIVIGENVTSIGDYAFYRFENVNLNDVAIPNSVTRIGKGAFSECNYLDGLTIPDSVTSIGDSAFSNCLNLKIIKLPSGLTSINSYMFQSCQNLTEVIIPDSVTTIGQNVFRYCYALTTVKLPENVTSIGDNTFESCSSLTSITIPEKVTKIGNNMFYRCAGLTSITIPEKVTSIGNNAFSSCTGLTSITIPKNVKTIGTYVFTNSTNIENIFVDSNNQYFTVVDGILFDKNMTTLICYLPKKADKSYVIPDSVKTIATAAFNGNTNLTSVTIPSTIKTINISAFTNCSSLTNVKYNGNETLWKKISVGDYNVPLTGATKEYFWYVTYIDENGNIFAKDTVTAGTTVTLPEIPTDDGCYVEYYGDEALTTLFDATSAIDANTNIYYKVISPDAITAEVQKDSTGYFFTIKLNESKIASFEEATLFAAVYDGDKFVAFSAMTIVPEGTEIPVFVETAQAATDAKFIIFDGFANLKPLCEHTELTVN